MSYGEISAQQKIRRNIPQRKSRTAKCPTAKCPYGEMSHGEVSHGEKSHSEMSGHGLTYMLLCSKLDLGDFQSLIKTFYFNFWDGFFLSTRRYPLEQYKKSHEIVKIMKHDQVAGLRNTANLSREYKTGAAITLNHDTWRLIIRILQSSHIRVPPYVYRHPL